MKNLLHNIFVIIAILILVPTAYSQDVGATFCWHYKEIYGGHDYDYNQSIVKRKIPENANWSEMEAWWQNMAEEVDYSGIDFIALLSRGNQPNAPDRGNGNPKHIPKLINAMNQRGATFKLAIFDDCPNAWTGSKNWNESEGESYTTTNIKFDCSNPDNYKYIWDYNLKEAIDHIPDEMRYKIDGRMVIFFWSAKPSWMTNLEGNLSKILQHIKDECLATYGFEPYLIIDSDWLDNDNSLTTATVDAVHNWFSAAGGSSYTLQNWNGVITGACVPGFGSPSHTPFLDPSMGTSDNGKRLKEGLENTVGAGARTTLVEGFTDAAEAAALWRSTDESTHTFYDYANQRLNILRRYTKNPYPDTLKIEAEACDFYLDLTPGNSGGKFLYQGNLDVADCSDTYGGWYVTNSQVNEWLEWKEVPITSGTKFELRYKSSAESSIEISVDGTSLGVINLPSTNDVWSTMDVGAIIMTKNGLHAVRITVISGNPHINYINRIEGEGSMQVALQAENASVFGAAIATNSEGFNGTGFVEYLNPSNDYIQWTVNVETTGDYVLDIRYAAESNNRPLELNINGLVKLSSMDFPATGDWTIWRTVSTTQALNEGKNTIKLTALDAGGANIDELVIRPVKINYLDDCESATDWITSGDNMLSVSSIVQQGSGSVQVVGNETIEFQKSFTTAYNSGATTANAVLEFWYYISNVSKLAFSHKVQISSSGGAGQNEYHWSLDKSSLQNGWNLIQLKISDAGSTNGEADLSAINWFSISNIKFGSLTTRIDGIRIYADKNTTSGISNNSNPNEGIIVYPNPATDVVKIITNRPLAGIRLFDLSGKLLITKEYKSDKTIELDVSKLKSGMYILETGETTHKLMIK